MKKQTLKLLSFIALSAITTQAKAQFSLSGDLLTSDNGIERWSFHSGTWPRAIIGNTTSYFQLYANNNQDNGPSLFMFTGTSAFADPGTIRFQSTNSTISSTTSSFEVVNHPNSSTWTPLFKVKSNGDAEVSNDLKVNGSAYAWDLSAQGNGYVNNTLKVGTTTTTGVVDCNGTVYTWDMLAHGNGYVNNTLKVGTTTTTGAIDCNGTITTWDVLAQGNGYIDGQLRIGTSVSMPSGYKLYVQDGILTEKVKVALSSDPTNWSDFVFDETYELRPLSEVEKFIQKNKHLPEIPSTAEVHKEGLDLAQMDAKLLQKVEELTLYIIQQQKEINNLKKQLTSK
ncbi:MAG: hypothetical protein J0L80_14240 [Chitinophagales bacterium]|nr:hypothetical protein [Chitinophagales bacterium]